MLTEVDVIDEATRHARCRGVECEWRLAMSRATFDALSATFGHRGALPPPALARVVDHRVVIDDAMPLGVVNGVPR